MTASRIRIVGDPVLRQSAELVTDIDDRLVRLTRDMAETMYAAPGAGLAAPQVGIKQRFFVYDLGDDQGARTLINPEVVDADGEWLYDEGCLSVPGLFFEIARPKRVHVRGIDLDGNEVDWEADEFAARLIQHELDHLNGVLLLDHLEADQRKQAKKQVREMMMGERAPQELPDRSRKRLGADVLFGGSR
ncbi:MAG: peptide deformylase [Microthrixaceae bacterium]